jgi:hypothetical protein
VRLDILERIDEMLARAVQAGQHADEALTALVSLLGCSKERASSSRSARVPSRRWQRRWCGWRKAGLATPGHTEETFREAGPKTPARAFGLALCQARAVHASGLTG